MKTYNALSKSFTDEVKTKMGGGKSIDEAFNEVKSELPPPNNNITLGDGEHNGFYYVDLGLSVNWATCNIGAKLASDDGKLFQFGRVDGYKYNDGNNAFKTYDDNTSETGNQFVPISSSETTYDLNAILQNNDDAASIIMKSDWKMPDKSKIEELIQHTTHKVEMIDNKLGVLFKSTVKGYEDKSLFIPFGGYWDGTKFTDDNICGCIWSSQVYNSSNTYGFMLRVKNNNDCEILNYDRARGYSIRGVFEK